MAKYYVGFKKKNFTIIDIKKNGKDRELTLRCDCGATVVQYDHIKTSSCGCKQTKKTENSNFEYDSENYKKRWYRKWAHMIERCYSKNFRSYKNYGGKGITVCDRWREPKGVGFKNFYNDIHEKLGPEPSYLHTLDRIDGDKGYEINNVRWSTIAQQNRNRKMKIKNESGEDVIVKTGVYWTYKRCLDLYKKYGKMLALRINHRGAYNAIYRNGWLDDIYNKRNIENELN